VNTQTNIDKFIWLPGDIEIIKPSPALKATGDLAAINATYHDAITESLITYFEGGSLAASKNSFKRAMIEAFGGAWDAGWDGNPPTGEALEWFNARTQQELAFIDGLYVQAKELRKDPEADTFAWATARADGYTATVDNIYNHARIRALGNKMLTFDGEDGSPDNICQSTNGTCVRLKGKRHRASWWIAHDLVPYRGNPNYDCGAWECRHYLKDDKGERYTFGGGSQAVKHEGPGNHPGTGSPQEVHAGEGGYYHGTDSAFAKSIKENGLRVGTPWEGRPPSVYFIETEKEALSYGNMFSRSETFAIVEFELPREWVSKIQPDNVDRNMIDIIDDKFVKRGGTASRIESDIPAKYIKSVRIYSKSTGELLESIKAASISIKAAARTYFAVVLKQVK
jgi:hypothetical protein